MTPTERPNQTIPECNPALCGKEITDEHYRPLPGEGPYTVYVTGDDRVLLCTGNGPPQVCAVRLPGVGMSYKGCSKLSSERGLLPLVQHNIRTRQAKELAKASSDEKV